MNRIYQGRLTRVEVSDGKGGWHLLGFKQEEVERLNKERERLHPLTEQEGSAGEEAQKKLAEINRKLNEPWQSALRKHHELFQDAVNYYLASFAVMATGCKRTTTAGRFRNALRGAWKQYAGPQGTWERPFQRVTALVAGDKAATFPKFAAALARLTGQQTRSKSSARGIDSLVTQLTQGESPNRRWEKVKEFCTHQNRQASEVEQYQQARAAQAVARRCEADESARLTLKEVYFFKRSPGHDEAWTPEQTRTELNKRFDKVAETFHEVAALKKEFEVWLISQPENFNLSGPGKKTQRDFDPALIFHLFPRNATRTAFLEATNWRRRQKLVVKKSDPFKAAGFVFPFFSNLALERAAGEKVTQAIWQNFDKAAAIAALTSLQQFCTTTSERDTERADKERERKQYLERGDDSYSGDAEEEPTRICGFEKDHRVKLVKGLVMKLGGERLNPHGKPLPYRIRSETLKSWRDLRKKWLELSTAGPMEEATLNNERRKMQKKRREEFGSAELFAELAKPRLHSLWKDKPLQPWHAEDILQTWAAYVEVCEELERLNREVSFTPAHAEHSPRYFTWSETLGKKHACWAGEGDFIVECDILHGTGSRKPNVVNARLHFSAPRLLRDQLRKAGEKLEEKNPDTSWLPPVIAGRAELAAAAGGQTFAGTSMRLSPGTGRRVLLDFATEIKVEALRKRWAKWYPLTANFKCDFKNKECIPRYLLWPKVKWRRPWTSFQRFTWLASDLGLRRPAAWAVLEAETFAAKPNARRISPAKGQQWFAAPKAMGVVRLPGEDARVWREESRAEGKSGTFDANKPHEEFWGAWGRPADADETKEARKLFGKLKYPASRLPADWKERWSFPEQNDALLDALRLLRRRIALFHRWGWMLKQDEERRKSALADIADGDVSRKLKKQAQAADVVGLCEHFSENAASFSALLKKHLLTVANRVMPNRVWAWKEREGGWCELVGKKHPDDANVKVMGQRGISLTRLQQLQTVRQLCQSFNKLRRRTFGEAARTELGTEIPDPCPKVFEEYEKLREQRINHIAHALFAQAVGVREVRRTPAELAKRLGIALANQANPSRDELAAIQKACHERDLHAIYEPIPGREPVDFIVLEDLTGYRTSALRSRRENRQLSRWCHGHTVQKIKELCEPLSIPILRIRAADTSRFCSRTGVAGIRVEEVSLEDQDLPGWQRILSDDSEDENKEAAKRLFEQLKSANEKITERKKRRTLLAPRWLGPLFIPLKTLGKPDPDKPDSPANADINAAVFAGLRATAHLDVWEIHTKQWLGSKPRRKRNDSPKKSKTGTYYYADFSGIMGGRKMKPEHPAPVVPADKKFWEHVWELAWKRCQEINAQRMKSWGLDATASAAADNSSKEEDNVSFE